MSTLNLKAPYGVVYGHDVIRYTQDGKNFDARYRLVDSAPKKEAKVQKTDVTKVTPIENARLFLIQILRENPLSKSAVYKEAENNNHNWNDVRDAAIALGIEKSTKNNLEIWKLPESVGV